jgi:hypothetical protein
MAEYISGEKHRELIARQRPQNNLPMPILAIAGVVILMGLSFYGGVAYQKGHQPKTASAAAAGAAGRGGFAGRGQFGGGQRPTIGSVTAITAGSITVQDSRSGTSTTLSITSSTQITNSGQAAAASDITVGENVLIVASTTDKTQAARILINPSFSGGASSPANSSTPAVTN